MPLRVLLADDHRLFCEGLSALLGKQDDMEVVGIVSDGREVLGAARALMPDVVVMDVSMPGMNGIEAAERVRAEMPETRVVMLSMHDSLEHVFRALLVGADGYLLKEAAGPELVAAVRTVAAGKRFLSRRLSVLPELARRLGSSSPASPLDSLSPRERETLQLVVEGKSSAEIAALLGLSRKTVETYRSRLMTKLGIKDVPSLVRFAIEHGISGPV